MPCCNGGRSGCDRPQYIQCNQANSPCGICGPPAPSPCSNSPCSPCSNVSPCGDKFAGSFLVDILAAVIFFFFWMMQFWLNMAQCLYQVLKYLYCAERPIQIVVATLLILLVGTAILHGMFGGGCCQKSASVRGKCPKAGKGGGDVGASVSVNANANAKLNAKASVTVPQKPCKISSSSSLRIKFKDSKQDPSGAPTEKTFYLTITDEKKKKLYQASAKFNLPPTDKKPTLVVSTDPIIIDNY